MASSNFLLPELVQEFGPEAKDDSVDSIGLETTSEVGTIVNLTVKPGHQLSTLVDLPQPVPLMFLAQVTVSWGKSEKSGVSFYDFDPFGDPIADPCIFAHVV